MSDAVDAINAALGLDADSLSAEHPPRLIYVDSDGNGTVDGCIEVFPNGKVRRWLDANEDGKWDTLVIDADGDGVSHEAYYDLDKDGLFDLEWTDENGDGKPAEDEFSEVEPTHISGPPLPPE